MNNKESSKCNIYLYFLNMGHNSFLVTFYKYRLPTKSIGNNFPTTLGMKIILRVMISRCFWQCQKEDILLCLCSETLLETILCRGFQGILDYIFLWEGKVIKFSPTSSTRCTRIKLQFFEFCKNSLTLTHHP